MLNRWLLIVCLWIIFSVTALAQAPRVFLMDAGRLTALKKKIRSGDAPTLLLLDSLKVMADRYLAIQPMSVVTKSFTLVSGDKHDYMSQAPYFWYDSSKVNGLPYIRRDGQHNPEIKKITDRTYIGRLEDATRTLSLAFFITSEEKYADKASSLIRYWFFNEATKMNPHL